MDIQIILSQLAVLFILLAAGFIVGKLNILTSDGNRTLTKVVLFIALPCTIFNSVLGIEPEISFSDTMNFLLICFLSFALAFAIAIPAVRLSGAGKTGRGLLTYMSVFSNCGFMGFPVALAVFGSVSGFYTAIYNIPFNLLSFSVGLILVAGKGEKFNYKLLLNPPLLASILAIPLAFSGFRPTYMVSEAVRLMGAVTTPGAMLVIGSTLALVPLRGIFQERRIIISGLLKLIIIPCFTWLVFRNFIADNLLLGVLVLLSGMPTAAQSAMLALQYNGNEKTASAGVFVTTLLCAVTLPILIYFLIL